MKTKILFFFIAMSMIQFGYAQLSFGIEGGMNLSSFKHTGFKGVDYKASINYFAGISPQHTFNPKISVITDINYSVIGYQIDVGGNIENFEFRYSYLSLAPQLEYRIHKIIGIGLGFYAGLNLDEEQKNFAHDWESAKETASIKSSDLGLVVSIRVYFGNFFIKLAYEHGLQNIDNEVYINPWPNQPEITKQNRNYQFGIGYLINFK